MQTRRDFLKGPFLTGLALGTILFSGVSLTLKEMYDTRPNSEYIETAEPETKPEYVKTTESGIDKIEFVETELAEREKIAEYVELNELLTNPNLVKGRIETRGWVKYVNQSENRDIHTGSMTIDKKCRLYNSPDCEGNSLLLEAKDLSPLYVNPHVPIFSLKDSSQECVVRGFLRNSPNHGPMFILESYQEVAKAVLNS